MVQWGKGDTWLLIVSKASSQPFKTCFLRLVGAEKWLSQQLTFATLNLHLASLRRSSRSKQTHKRVVVEGKESWRDDLGAENSYEAAPTTGNLHTAELCQSRSEYFRVLFTFVVMTFSAWQSINIHKSHFFFLSVELHSLEYPKYFREILATPPSLNPLTPRSLEQVPTSQQYSECVKEL